MELSSVTEIYGKLPSDFIGGGRASVLLKKLPLARFKEHIREISKRGIIFNYLLNAACLCNKEFSIKEHKEICKLLDLISEHEIPMVTVGLPQIVMLIKSKYPCLKISVSTNCMVDNLERVKYWEEHGADQITISYTDLNRDFKELDRMTKHAKCELQTICNFICRKHCP